MGDRSRKNYGSRGWLDLVKFFPRRFLQRDTAKLRVYERVRQRRTIFYKKGIDTVRGT